MPNFCLRLVGHETINGALEDRVGELLGCGPLLWSREGQVFLEFEGIDRDAAISTLEDAGIPVVLVNG